MMTATPNDVCLRAHFMANIASLRHEAAQHHFERSEKHHIAIGDASLKSPQFPAKPLHSHQFYDIISQRTQHAKICFLHSKTDYDTINI